MSRKTRPLIIASSALALGAAAIAFRPALWHEETPAGPNFQHPAASPPAGSPIEKGRNDIERRALAEKLEKGDGREKAKAISALGAMLDGESVGILIGMLSRERDIFIKVRIVGELGNSDLPQAKVALMRLLEEDPQPEIRKEAAWSLKPEKDKAALEALASHLWKEPDKGVRSVIVLALSRRENEGMMDALKRWFYREPDFELRQKIGEIISGREWHT